MKIIYQFDNQYAFLSNFWRQNFMFDDLIWKSVEHAYQAGKTTNIEDQETIRLTDSPGEAKRFGRVVELRPDWEAAKYKFMETLIYAKFTQNPDLKQRLIDTEDAMLIEGNAWGDREWGMCWNDNEYSLEGANNLGITLQKVRDNLSRATYYTNYRIYNDQSRIWFPRQASSQ